MKFDIQIVKDKYGDNLDEDDSSTDESEDEDAKKLTKDVEIEFFKALSMVKSKDSKIYDKEHCRFFDKIKKENQEEDDSNDEDSSKKTKKKKSEKKSFYLKDLEREMILKK